MNNSISEEQNYSYKGKGINQGHKVYISFRQCLLSSYHVPGSIYDSENTKMNLAWSLPLEECMVQVAT